MASDDDADSVSGEEHESQGGKSGTIFLIDSRLSMFSKDFMDTENVEQTRFNIAIKVSSQLLSLNGNYPFSSTVYFLD